MTGTKYVSDLVKSVMVEDQPSVVATVAAYIDLNPVRAGLVEDSKDYRWCGYAEAVVAVVGVREGCRRFHEATDWRAIAKEYRQYLFSRAGVSGHSGKQALDRDAIRKVVEEGGDLALAEVLRLRVRYFTDGVAIGSKGFVEGVFSGFRDRFGATRKSGARPLRAGPVLGNLSTLRNLKTDAFG